MSDAQVIQTLRTLEAAARIVNDRSQYKQDIDGVQLSDKELTDFDKSMTKVVRRANQGEDGLVINSIFMRRRVEILIGLLAAKKLFQLAFHGTEPADGFGVMWNPEAGIFGKGRDWDSDSSITGGAPVNWIHSGSTQLGGSAGNPIAIGSSVFHVVLGFADYSIDTPRIIKFLEQINAAPLPAVIAEESFRTDKDNQTFRVHEVDNARYLKTTMTYRVQAQSRVTNLASEWIKPLVVTFAKQNVFMQTDLGNQTAATLNNLNIVNTA